MEVYQNIMEVNIMIKVVKKAKTDFWKMNGMRREDWKICSQYLCISLSSTKDHWIILDTMDGASTSDCI